MGKMRRLSPRDLRRLMKRMGVEVEEFHGVREVRIIMEDREMVVEDPHVTLMRVQGQDILQVVGNIREIEISEEPEIEIPEEDVQLVASQTGVSLEKAREALVKTSGDIAQAIMLLESLKDKY